MSEQPTDGEQPTSGQPTSEQAASPPTATAEVAATPERTAAPPQTATTDQSPAEHAPTPEQRTVHHERAASTRQPPELVKRAPSPFGQPTAPDEVDSPRPASDRLPERVTTGLLTVAVGGLLTFLAAFLTWATVELTSRAGGPLVGGGTRSVSGLEGDRLGKATIVIAVAVLLLVVLLVTPAARRAGWIALAIAGALIIGFALIDLLQISDSSDLRERLAQVPGCSQGIQCTGERSAGIGVYLTLLGGLIVLIGALLHAGVLARLQERMRTKRSSQPV